MVVIDSLVTSCCFLCGWPFQHHLVAVCRLQRTSRSPRIWTDSGSSSLSSCPFLNMSVVVCVCVRTLTFLVNDDATKPRGPVSKTIKFGTTRRVNLKSIRPKTCYCCLLSTQRCKLMEICSACSEWGQIHASPKPVSSDSPRLAIS